MSSNNISFVKKHKLTILISVFLMVVGIVVMKKIRENMKKHHGIKLFKSHHKHKHHGNFLDELIDKRLERHNKLHHHENNNVMEHILQKNDSNHMIGHNKDVEDLKAQHHDEYNKSLEKLHAHHQDAFSKALANLQSKHEDAFGKAVKNLTEKQ